MSYKHEAPLIFSKGIAGRSRNDERRVFTTFLNLSRLKRKLFYIFVLFLFFGHLNSVSAQADSLPSSHFQSVEEEIDSLIAYAKEFMGLKYRYGNNTPTGFDCSGFTGYIFSQFGYKLGRSAANQYNDGILVSKEEMKPGDLVFFQEKSRINHVGIIVSADTAAMTFRFIHSCRRGVLIDDSTMEYYQKRFYAIRRIIGIEE